MTKRLKTKSSKQSTNKKSPEELIIVDDCYKVEWLIIKGGSQDDTIKKFSKRWNLEYRSSGEDTTAIASFISNPYVKSGAIWFENKNPSASIVAHECLHLVTHLFNFIGQPITVSNDEAGAYYMEWMVEEILKK